jgi:hypothetical protein
MELHHDYICIRDISLLLEDAWIIYCGLYIPAIYLPTHLINQSIIHTAHITVIVRVQVKNIPYTITRLLRIEKSIFGPFSMAEGVGIEPTLPSKAVTYFQDKSITTLPTFRTKT